MRTVKAKIVVDQRWLACFLDDYRDPETSTIDTKGIKFYSGDRKHIVDILEQIYQQDLEQQNI